MKAIHLIAAVALLAAGALAQRAWEHRAGSLAPAAHAEAAPEPAKEAHEEEPASLTHYTEASELFMEYADLVVGAEAEFLVHLTRLPEFRPVTEGRVTVTLHGGGAEERFAADAPEKPGIFHLHGRPATAGRRQLRLTLLAGGVATVHELGEVEVHATAPKEDHAAHADEAGRIRYTKERQWAGDFAALPVATRSLREAVPATALLRAPAGAEAFLVAPAAGSLRPAGHFPRVGERVEKGRLLAWLTPRLGGDSDWATLELEVRRARLSLESAGRERKRLEDLYAVEAVAERRVVDARHGEEVAQAELDAALKRQAPYNGGAGGIALRAPASGVVLAVNAAPGAAVAEGQTLLHLADLSRVWLEARLPADRLGRLARPDGAWFTVEGFEQGFQVGAGSPGRLVAVGGAVDAETRTAPVIFELPNPDGRLKAGLFAQAQVYTGQTQTALAVPAAALVDEDGASVVFVQVEGEEFERRRVRPGLRDGDWVAVEGELKAGERVVSRGAYQVKLAASAPASLAHGHAHAH